MAFVWMGLHPTTRAAIRELQAAARAEGFRFVLTSGFRDLSTQAALIRSGRAITPAAPGRSTHNYGLSFDAVAPGHQEELGELAEQLGIVWGGRLSRPDPVHFQILPFAAWAAILARFGL